MSNVYDFIGLSSYYSELHDAYGDLTVGVIDTMYNRSQVREDLDYVFNQERLDTTPHQHHFSQNPRELNNHGAMTIAVLSKINVKIKLYDHTYLLDPVKLERMASDCNMIIMSAGWQISSTHQIVETLRLSTQYLRDRNIILMASSANSYSDGTIAYPARLSGWIAVGAAILENGKARRAPYSSSGTANCDPYRTVQSVGITNLSVVLPDGSISVYDGTSCANPAAALVIATFMTKFKKKIGRFPTNKEVNTFIRISSVPMYNSEGTILYEDYHHRKGWGVTVLPECKHMDDIVNHVYGHNNVIIEEDEIDDSPVIITGLPSDVRTDRIKRLIEAGVFDTRKSGPGDKEIAINVHRPVTVYELMRLIETE